jgi:hypothetical protein
VKVEYITVAYVDSVALQQTILCHIDNTPCLDSAWIAAKEEQGVAGQLL